MKNETRPLPLANDFPKSLLPIVDKVVAHAVKGTSLPKNLSKLVGWFEDEGWDDLCSAWGEESVALKLFEMAWLKFSDQELLANLDEPISVTDEVRLTYARELVRRAFEESDGYACPTVHAVQIFNKQGHEAILGWLMPIHGQGGPVAEFQGVFRDKSHFYKSLHDADYLLAPEEKSLKDETILRLWAKQSKPTRNVTVSVAWGNELHDCPMSQRSWQRVLAGKTLKRVESFFYEGKGFKANWVFNHSSLGSLLVTYSDEAVGFDGKLSEAEIFIDEKPVVWIEQNRIDAIT